MTIVAVVVAGGGDAPSSLVDGWNVAALVTGAFCALGAAAIALNGRGPAPSAP